MKAALPQGSPTRKTPPSSGALSQMLFLSKLQNERKVKLSEREREFCYLFVFKAEITGKTIVKIETYRVSQKKTDILSAVVEILM